jgi:hypothetical protein
MIQACITECVDDAPQSIPDACMDCIYTYSQACSDLFGMCFIDDGPCDVAQQQP